MTHGFEFLDPSVFPELWGLGDYERRGARASRCTGSATDSEDPGRETPNAGRTWRRDTQHNGVAEQRRIAIFDPLFGHFSLVFPVGPKSIFRPCLSTFRAGDPKWGLYQAIRITILACLIKQFRLPHTTLAMTPNFEKGAFKRGGGLRKF